MVRKPTLDLSHPNNYEFHNETIKNGCVTKALIYGPNGSGKSNLGLAIFDIIFHLTDKEKKLSRYNNYRNLNSPKMDVLFEYCFDFNNTSTGTVSLTLFYYWYMKMEMASFVLIDEFDAFYHYELAEALVKLLRGLPDTQVLLTTHNTDLMNNDLLRPDCYFLINGNQINDLPSLTERELRKAHNLQKMYKAGAFHE